MYTNLSQITPDEQATYFLMNDDVFEKDGKLFRLPMWNKDESIPDKSAYSFIKQFISNSADKLHELIDKENTHVISYAGLGSENFALIEHSSKRFRSYTEKEQPPSELSQKSLSRNKNERIKNLHYKSKNFIRFNYSLEGNNKIVISNSFKNMVTLLLSKEKCPKKTTISFEHFSDLIDSMVRSINDLFIQQGIQPTAQNRDNLISLAYGLDKSLTKGKKFNTLLGTTAETYKLTHPALIKAANEGYNDGIFKMLYVHAYNLKNMKDIELFKNIPYSIFEAVVGKTK